MSLSKLLKTNLIWIVLVVVVISLVVGGILLSYRPYGRYERNIQRNIDSEEEARVLEAVENFDYNETLGIARYHQDDWANFIDSEVIEHYNSEYEFLREQDAEHDIFLNYKVKIFKEQDLNMHYDCSPGGLREGSEYQIELSTMNGTIHRISEFFFPAVIVEFIEEERSDIDSEQNFERNFTNVYTVCQYLDYSNTWDYIGGYGVRIHQIVIINENLQPIFIMIDTQQWIS